MSEIITKMTYADIWRKISQKMMQTSAIRNDQDRKIMITWAGLRIFVSGFG